MDWSAEGIAKDEKIEYTPPYAGTETEFDAD
jgi:hypothetical protein